MSEPDEVAKQKPEHEVERRDATSEFGRRVGAQEVRKVKAQRKPGRSEWVGFAMFGLVGWSVAVPTLVGAGIGWWLDNHHPSQRSWTLALLVAGLILGCVNAWHWVSREDKAMHSDNGDGGDTHA